MYYYILVSGSPWLPSRCSLRVLASTWWLFCIVILATYSGNLTAFLAVAKRDLPLNSLEELGENYHYTVAVVEQTALRQLLEVTNANKPQRTSNGCRLFVTSSICKWKLHFPACKGVNTKLYFSMSYLLRITTILYWLVLNHYRI